MKTQFRRNFNFSGHLTNHRCLYYGIVFAALMFISNLQAAVYTLLPSDDGYVTPNNGINDGGYLLVGANGWDGVVKFSLSSVQGIITQATLTVNPYGLPLYGNPVDVYGRGDSSGLLATSDFGMGSYLGSWTLPNLGYGQDASFDVTGLLSSLNTPFVAFNLRSGGVDVFSSLHYNYGHPSELIITTAVPEPSTISLLIMGFLGAAWRLRKSTGKGRFG